MAELSSIGTPMLSISHASSNRSGPAIKRIGDSPLSEVVVTNSIPLTEEAKATGKFKVVSIARLMAEAIRRIHNSDSVSSLFV